MVPCVGIRRCAAHNYTLSIACVCACMLLWSPGPRTQARLFVISVEFAIEVRAIWKCVQCATTIREQSSALSAFDFRCVRSVSAQRVRTREI